MSAPKLSARDIAQDVATHWNLRVCSYVGHPLVDVVDAAVEGGEVVEGVVLADTVEHRALDVAGRLPADCNCGWP